MKGAGERDAPPTGQGVETCDISDHSIRSFSGHAGLLGAYKTSMGSSYFPTLFIYFQTLNPSGPYNSGVKYSFIPRASLLITYTLVLATFLRPC